MKDLAFLVAAGVPLVSDETAIVDWDRVAAAVRTALASPLPEREHLALSAWLHALQSHFPTHARSMGLDAALPRPRDPRWYSLRRIAIARLALIV